MFEGLSDGDLIDVMGEATRDESTAIAQRLAAVAQLFVRRSAALAKLDWCCADGCDAVAAEIAAVQHISHARAVGQVQFACALWHRLPAVARVSRRGTIDFRVVSTIVSRTENVDEAVMPQLDDAIARHAEKWMRLSGPKLRDRVDQWVAKFDPAGVRVPPKVNDNRYVDIDPASPGMAGLSGLLHATDGAALDAAAGRVGGHRVRKTIRAPKNSAAPTPAGRWGAVRPRWPASAAPATARRSQSVRPRPCGGDSCAGRAGHPRRHQ